MKKQLKPKLHTSLEKIRSLVTDALAEVNGGGAVPARQRADTETCNVTGCSVHTLP